MGRLSNKQQIIIIIIIIISELKKYINLIKDKRSELESS